MTDVALSACKVFEECGQARKRVIIRTNDAVANSVVLTPIVLANYGITNLLSVDGYSHSTTDSIIVPKTFTTSVTTGTLSVTVDGTTGTKVRVAVIEGY